jgi:hypothetical protein
MKTIIIVGAASLAAYYAYQKLQNPNVTPQSFASSLISQATTLVSSQPAQDPPVVPSAASTSTAPASPVVPATSPGIIVPKPPVVNNPLPIHPIRIVGVNSGLLGLS